MNLKIFHKIEIAVNVVVILLLALWLVIKEAASPAAAQILGCGIVALALGWTVLALIFRRCPHCHSFFRRYRQFCGQCGKELDW